MGFYLPVLYPLNFLQARIWDNVQVHLVFFLFPRHHCPLLSDVQYLKDHFPIYFIYFYLFKRLSLVPFIAFPLEAKVPEPKI